MPAEHYDSRIYPLQNEVIAQFRGSPFYLTGGTALSRAYYNHRYSDDLDYFVNDNPDFLRHAERCISKLRVLFQDVHVALQGDHFIRLFVAPERMKVELIDDVPAHVGTLVDHPTLGSIDSKENILANKVTALVDRSMPKDIADIYALLQDGLSIKQALLDAGSKAAGISPLLVAKVLAEFDYPLLDSEVRWITPVPSAAVRSFLTDLSTRIVRGMV